MKRSKRCQRFQMMFALRARILYAVYYNAELKEAVEATVGVPLGNSVPLPRPEKNQTKISAIIDGRETALPAHYKRSFCQIYTRSLAMFFVMLLVLSTPVEVFAHGVVIFLVMWFTCKLVKGCCRCMCGRKQQRNDEEQTYSPIVQRGFPADIEMRHDVALLEDKKTGAIFVGVPVSVN